MRKNVIISTLASVAFAYGLVANADSIKNAAEAISFIAPTVQNVDDVDSNLDGGAIVLDASDGAIKAKNWGSTSGWQVLSPTSSVSTPTTASNSRSILATEDVILVDSSTSAFTLDLPSAVGVAGKVYEIKKTDSSFNAVTIDGYTSQTIDGQTTTTVNTQYESIKIVSDGSNWHVLDRNIPSSWTSSTMTIDGSTTAPTKGTMNRDEFRWRRVGDSMEVHYNFDQTAAGSAGSGVYLFPIPNGLSIDTSKIAAPGIAGQSVVGQGEVVAGGYYFAKVHAYDSQNLFLSYKAVSLDNVYDVGSSNTPMSITAMQFTFRAVVPISGWKN